MTLDEAIESICARVPSKPADRIIFAREVADHLDALLAAVDRGELVASATDVARLEGAVVALRALSK